MNILTIISVPFSIFLIGLLGVLTNRRSIILIILCVELMLLAINFFFLITSFYLDDVLGQVFSVFILVVASAETSIGLALLVTYYRLRGTISIKFLNILKC
mgnify:CR=1 FL=1|tara:strand:+ start:615 stop:917 length:303 start_codon:yes stop_codon:yes gene_type:complete